MNQTFLWTIWWIDNHFNPPQATGPFTYSTCCHSTLTRTVQMSCSWSLVSWVTQLRNSCSQLMIWASCQRRELTEEHRLRDITVLLAYCHCTDPRSAQTHWCFTVPLSQDQPAGVSAVHSHLRLPSNKKRNIESHTESCRPFHLLTVNITSATKSF